MAKIILNLIPEEKYFIWMPEKTATTHAFEVFKHFKITPSVISNGKVVNHPYVEQTYTHECNLFEGHENYKFISTARNPYSRFVSFYKFMGHEKRNFSFNDYVHFFIYEKPSKQFLFTERTPDYFIRMEHMFEDYLKIPFIKESELNKSGELESICKVKINSNKFNYDFKDYYNQDIADAIYYNFFKYFDLLGYDKNSWKK